MHSGANPGVLFPTGDVYLTPCLLSLQQNKPADPRQEVHVVIMSKEPLSSAPAMERSAFNHNRDGHHFVTLRGQSRAGRHVVQVKTNTNVKFRTYSCRH